MQLIVNFVTISMEPFAVSVPGVDVNGFAALYASRLEDAEGFLVCYHANVARSLQAATRLIKELIAVKRTGFSVVPIPVLLEILHTFVELSNSRTSRPCHSTCLAIHTHPLFLLRVCQSDFRSHSVS